MSFVILAIINPGVLKASLMFIFPIAAILFIVLGALGKTSLWDWIDKLEKSHG
jgi:hypothetical protein